MNLSVYEKTEYRNDIQGVRAIGAILIMVFHIWFSKVSGGVDVFFVVSGFLMTSLLLSQILGDGNLNPLLFWSQIIKRVAPAAYTVLAFSLLAGYFFLPVSEVMNLLSETLASALHFENIQLIRKGVQYLTFGDGQSPVQQFWALSIQMQFYLLLPLLVIPSALVAKKLRSAVPLFAIFLVSICLSFVFSVVSTLQDPVGSYFHTLTRLWEFLLGGLTFLILPFINFKKHCNIATNIGFILIFGAAFFLPRTLDYPGFAALFPTIGACLVILSGRISSTSIASSILNNKVLTTLGGFSFTLYLWHWPLLIFYKSIFSTASVGFIHGVAIICASIILALLTTQYIETPFRRYSKMKMTSNLCIGALFFAPVTAGAYVVQDHFLNLKRQALDEQHAVKPYFGDTINMINQHSITREKLIIAKEIQPLKEGCRRVRRDSAARKCSFGRQGATKLVILAGGSHAWQWFPALDDIAQKYDFELMHMTKGGCTFGHTPGLNKKCIGWNKAVVEEISEIKPDVLITNSTRSRRGKEWIPTSFVDQWRSIKQAGITIVGIRDNPHFGTNVPRCIAEKKTER